MFEVCPAKSISYIRFDVIMSYDEWTIFEDGGKYYIADYMGIREVYLTKVVERNEDNKYLTPDTVCGICDYCGESDDLQYYLGFNDAQY